MVVMPTSSDWVTPTPTSCLWVSTITTSNTIGELVLIRNWRCSILWLPIGILCSVECEWEYTSSFLFLIQIEGWIYWLHAFQSVLDYMNFWFPFLWLIH
jgi:hypothetical protein